MTASAAKRPVVLIVEDELLLRINAAEMIEEAGFDVPALEPGSRKSRRRAR
jgi:hypothetical protein